MLRISEPPRLGYPLIAASLGQTGKVSGSARRLRMLRIVGGSGFVVTLLKNG
jgi:hypothetical protein